MTEKRFHWDWKTGRMKDTYSNFQATKNMRLIERQVNDACNNYEKQITKLKKENEQLQIKNNAYFQDIEVYKEENTHLKLENDQLKELLECSRKEANDYCEELMGKDEFLRLYKEENERLQHQLSQQEMEYATTAYRQAEENEKLKLEIQKLRKDEHIGWKSLPINKEL